MRRVAFLLGVVGVATLGAAGVLRGRASTVDVPVRPEATTPSLPRPVAPAFTVATPRALSSRPARATWAAVRLSTIARRAPNVASAAVTSLSTETPEETANLVLVVGRRRVGRSLWVRVRLPVLPNNTVGWVRRDALGGYQVVSTHLVVDRERLDATLYRDGRPIFHAPVGVGTPQAPTPAGSFYVRNTLTTFPESFYGPVAFGTSARSAVLTDWPAGGFVGIHGTSRPELIPGRVSHGCVRMRNPDILRLARLMPVGTPLTIR